MTRDWGDLVARARGLGSRLLPAARLATLAGAETLADLAAGLRQSGIALSEDDVASEALERAVRRDAARQLRVLARWSGRRIATLAVIFEEEDRRSLRAILRGAVQGVAAEQRLAGLLPTPALPERALEELARQPTVTAVAALLTAWRHPFAAALAAETASPHPDLLHLESALAKAFAESAARSARRGGSRLLAAQVRETVDIENAMTALMLAGGDHGVTPRDLFLAGGSRVTIDVFEQAAAAGDRAAAAARLAVVFAGAPPARALREAAADAADVDRALLEARITGLRARARTGPLDETVVLLFALRLRAQVADLCRIIWGVTLGAPPALRVPSRGAA